MERTEAIKIIKTATVYTPEEMEALETLIPELKESEDERMRKRVIESLVCYRGKVYDEGDKEVASMVDEEIIWMRKQKEQKPTDEQFPPLGGLDAIKAKYYDDGFKNGFDEGVASVKPADELDYSGLNDLERAIHRGFLAAGVENVPVGIIKETAKDCLVQTGLIRYELPEDFEEAVFNVVNYISPFSSEEELREKSHRFAEQLLSLAKKEVQKSTWSEEDENMLYDIRENYKLRIYLCKSQIEWIESLKHRIQLQPKQEWSEEDEKKIVELKTFIARCNGFNKENRKKAFDMIDAIRHQPKQEWSEEDEKMIELIRAIVFGTGKVSNGVRTEIWDWLKSLRPSWKPDGQQLDCLRHMINVSTVDKIDKQLVQDLYEQLKKLI